MSRYVRLREVVHDLLEVGLYEVNLRLRLLALARHAGVGGVGIV
jgi:hypothetical protein